MNQEIFDLLGASGDLLFIVHQIGTDEHKGSELGLINGVVLEEYVGILIEETKLQLIFLVQLVRTFLAMQMAEELDKLILEPANDRILQQLPGLLGFQSHISNIDAWHSYAHLLLEHGQLYGEQNLSVAFADLLDLTLTSGHRTVDNRNIVSLVNILGRLAI